MSRLVKIQSTNQGVYNNANKIIRLGIPTGSRGYNFHDSYMLLDVDANVRTHPGRVKWLLSQHGLIRNAKLISQKKGVLESLQEFGMLKANLDTYTKTPEELAKRVFTVDAGTNHVQALKFNLPEMFSFFRTAVARNMSIEHYGEIMLELEVERDRPLIERDDGTTMYAPDQALAAPRLNDIVVDGDVPFLCVGMHVTVSRSVGGAAVAGVNTTVQTLTPNAENGTTTIEFADAMGADGDALTQISITQRAGVVFDQVPTVTRAQIVLVEHVHGSSPQKPSTVAFSTYHLERSPMTAADSFQRMYQLEPGTVLALMLTPQNGSIQSARDGVVNYRWSLNSEYTTNRPVPVDVQHSIQRMILEDSFPKFGEMLMNLNPGPFIVPQSCAPSKQMHNLQIILNANAAMAAKTVHLFKVVLRNM